MKRGVQKTCFLNFNVDPNHLEGLLKLRVGPHFQIFCLGKFEVGSRVCISSKFPGEAEAVDFRDYTKRYDIP